jgi:hypothetical protein
MIKHLEIRKGETLSMTKNPALFYGAIVVAIVGILLGVYYLIPGVYHPLTFSGLPTSAHYKHAALFFVIGVIGIIGALVSRPKAGA